MQKVNSQKQNPLMKQSIQERTKQYLWQTLFKKIEVILFKLFKGCLPQGPFLNTLFHKRNLYHASLYLQKFCILPIHFFEIVFRIVWDNGLSFWKLRCSSDISKHYICVSYASQMKVEIMLRLKYYIYL